MKIINTLLHTVHSAGVEESEYRSVKPEIDESNRKTLVSFSAIATIFLLIMTVISFIDPILQDNRPLYFFSAAGTAAIAFLGHGPAKKSGAMTTALFYVFNCFLMLFGIILGTVFSPNEATTTYIVLLIMVPQLFVDRPWRMYLMLLCIDLIYIYMVVTFKITKTWNSDIINSLIFGGVSSVCLTYMTAIKVQRFHLVETVRFMAENDQLTGLKNRNCYEQRLASETMLHADSIFCIYVDVNGLHELNNTQGHAAGDRMLQFVASAMQKTFGKENTYRVGGDEYVAFGTSMTQQTLDKKIAQLRKTVDDAGYHIAVGCCVHPKPITALESIVTAAEKEMYADKEAYYTRTGRSHSRR